MSDRQTHRQPSGSDIQITDPQTANGSRRFVGLCWHCDGTIDNPGHVRGKMYCGLPEYPKNCRNFCDSGDTSMSGGLDPGFTRDRIKPTTETRETRFRFFHNDHHTAHNGIDLICRVKVWEVIPESADEKEGDFAKSDGGSE